MPLECGPGTHANEAGTQCVPDDETAWYNDAGFWANMARSEQASGGPPDPFEMIAALIAHGQEPGSIDPNLPLIILPPKPTAPAIPPWLLPVGIGLAVLLLVRR